MDGGPLDAGEDKVVLVVSRTCVGQMAGRINEALFREHLFTGNGEPEVFTETVDDLRLEGIREEAGEAKSLSDRIREICNDHADKRAPLFNITGGFKGLIPAITVICAEGNRPMLYMHESMKGVVRLQFKDGRIREEYEDFNV
jgi:putative CRISPR-associated protein (TIGR02619 family)